MRIKNKKIKTTTCNSSPLCTWANPQRSARAAATVRSGSGESGLAASSPPVRVEVMVAEQRQEEKPAPSGAAAGGGRANSDGSGDWL